MAAEQGTTATCYLLDTNILVAYIRAGTLGHHIEKMYQLRTSPYKPLISIVSVGEVLSLANQFPWGEDKLATMQNLLKEFVHVDISDERVLQAYAKLDYFCLKECKPAEPIGKNDLWIAATAMVTGAVLLSTDKHFLKFHPKHMRVCYVDQGVVHREQ